MLTFLFFVARARIFLRVYEASLDVLSKAQKTAQFAGRLFCKYYIITLYSIIYDVYRQSQAVVSSGHAKLGIYHQEKANKQEVGQEINTVENISKTKMPSWGIT